MGSIRFISLALLATTIGACGGGGSSDPTQTGTVTLAMSDGPIDGYSKIIMVVDQVRFIADGGQDILVLDQPVTVDFLALSNFSEALIKREVVSGTYSKIRLILDSLTLVKTDAAGNVMQTDLVPLRGLQKIDINPQGSFTVRGGQEIVINVDLNLARSIHIVSAGNSGRINFRPVIFAAISTQSAFNKLFRVEGTIDSIDGTAKTLSVCDIRHVSDDGARMPNPKDVCVFTAPNDATRYFDVDTLPDTDGFGGLMVNDPVVMYGKFDSGLTEKFVPAVIAIGSRDTLSRERGIGSDFVPDPNDAAAPGTMNLDEVNAVCLSNPARREVDIDAATAVFSEDSLGNATPIVRTAIAKCRATETEGLVVNKGLADEFLRSFVVIQGDPVVAGEELFGTLAATSTAGQYTLTPNPMAANQCVIVGSTTVITQIETVNGTATVTHPTSVPLNVDVSVIGSRDAANCLAATEVIREM